MKNKNLKVVVLCDNKASFQLALQDADVGWRQIFGKAIVLVKADRLDHEDNERGLKLANKLADFLNTLTQDELRDLVADEAIPPLS